MNIEELAFFNQQLAGMVRAGIPLEGALRQLSDNLRKGALRSEMNRLAEDLSRGTPLAEALPSGNLPLFYRQMLLLGASSNNLPGLLTLVADYYQRLNILWTRLKGMLVYPVIVLVAAMFLSGGFSFLLMTLVGDTGFYEYDYVYGTERPPDAFYWSMAGIWSPPLAMLLLLLGLVVVLSSGRCRQALQWRAPGFREGSLAQLASSLALLLRAGCSLQEAVALLRQMTPDRRLGRELDVWQARLASGVSRFPEIVPSGSVVPPIWVWAVAHTQDDLSQGFQRAADLFQSRAQYRHELFLYAVLPVSVLFLGAVILGQVYFMIQVLMNLWGFLGDIGM